MRVLAPSIIGIRLVGLLSGKLGILTSPFWGSFVNQPRAPVALLTLRLTPKPSQRGLRDSQFPSGLGL